MPACCAPAAAEGASEWLNLQRFAEAPVSLEGIEDTPPPAEAAEPSQHKVEGPDEENPRQPGVEDQGAGPDLLAGPKGSDVALSPNAKGEEQGVAKISRATSAPRIMQAASQQRIGPELVGVAVAVLSPEQAAQTSTSHWERLNAINKLKLQKMEAGESLAEVRARMVGHLGPPLPEEVGYQFCCLCCCLLCCRPCRKLVRRFASTKPGFVDERQDRSYGSIASEFLQPATLFWMFVCLVIFCGWGYISWKTYPTAMSMTEHNACMYWSMLYLDFFPNVLTALIYHQCRCCHRLHKAEHQYVFQSPLKAQFSVGSAYFLYFNCWTGPMYVLTVMPSIIAETHYQSAIFYATLVQTVVLLWIRITMWVMEQRPSMYMYAPTCWLNFMRFFRTHFTIAAFDYYDAGRYNGWTKSTGYGNVMPFFDVCLGSCPFEVKWSVPIPFVDFITHPAEVWSEFVDPEKIYWTPMQKLWYFSWLVLIFVLTVYVFSIYWAPWGSCWPWGPVSISLGGQ